VQPLRGADAPLGPRALHLAPLPPLLAGTVGASSITSRQTPPTCLAVVGGGGGGGGFVPGTPVSTDNCNAADPLQGLAFSAATGLITHTASGMCVDGGSDVPPLDFCTTGNHSQWTICDPAADISARAADIVARLSLADKIQALGTGTPALPSVGMSSYQWWVRKMRGFL
jgi:hypothetical protein